MTPTARTPNSEKLSEPETFRKIKKMSINQPFDFPRCKARGLPFGPTDSTELAKVSGRGLSLPAPPSVGTGAGRQGLILHFDRLSVLSLPKEAALFTPS